MAPSAVLCDNISSSPRPPPDSLKTNGRRATMEEDALPLKLSDETTHLFHRSFAQPLKMIDSSDGHILTMDDGHRVLDACGGAAVACIGQGNKEVIAAAVDQMAKITYAHPLSYTTWAAEDVAKSFLGGNTWGLQKMFLVGSGKSARKDNHIHRPDAMKNRQRGERRSHEIGSALLCRERRARTC